MSAALVEALDRLRRKVEALQIERSHALKRFAELEVRLREARARIVELEAAAKVPHGG